MINIDILKDIADLLKDDKDHNLEVKVNNSGVTVYLDCDPNEELNRSCVIPIKYDTLDDYACIPSDELTDIFRPNEGGIELEEIKLVQSIMTYLENNSSKINELCSSYDICDRNSSS